ncbi:MAG: hypothetical protein HQ547_05415, partial [Candidatus Omnitrophica bacterium]|nr:hypothetical protein [Candidatus Omnitrophota bacterium]
MKILSSEINQYSGDPEYLSQQFNVSFKEAKECLDNGFLQVGEYIKEHPGLSGRFNDEYQEVSSSSIGNMSPSAHSSSPVEFHILNFKSHTPPGAKRIFDKTFFSGDATKRYNNIK